MSGTAPIPAVLVAHGTADPAGRDELRHLREAVAQRAERPVRIGVIEYPAAGLAPVFEAVAAAADEARAAAAGGIRLVPMLLFPAGHAHRDLAVIVRGARALHPDIAVGCVPLLGPAPALLAALAGRIDEAETAAGRRSEALLVVGRGSHVAHANARLPRLVGAGLHRLDGRPVGHAFVSLADPGLTAALRALHRAGVASVTVSPYLLNDGMIAQRARQEAKRLAAVTPGLRVVVAGHLGLHPAVVSYVSLRAAGVRGLPASARAGGATDVRPEVGLAIAAGGGGPWAAPRIRHPRPLVIAGTASGTGKTTVALGLMAALRGRGLRVQGFKAGPDYIDPLHHAAVTGRPSRNLDGVLCDPRSLPALAARAMRDADVAVVEGVLGLFDGRLGGGDAGSTAEVAKRLDAAVLLVVDAARAARSTAAVALGFARFDPQVRIAGAILNRVGSEHHARAAREEVERATGIPVLGSIPHDPQITLFERYLGLVPPQERQRPLGWVERLRAVTEASVDVDAVLELGRRGPGPRPDPLHDPFAAPRHAARARIAVASDAAFSFVYRDALDLLEHHGAELVGFSPLTDSAPPAGCDALLLPGGFPERFASTLEENAPMRGALAEMVRAGTPTVAECGGAMYLGDAITLDDGARHAMCGVLPFGSRVATTRQALGYRSVIALRDSPLLGAGERATGHEFHWSRPEPGIDRHAAAYAVAETADLDGHATGGLVASYVHLHLCGHPESASRLVACAVAHRQAARPAPVA